MRRKVARVLFCASLCLSLLAFAGCSAESTTGGASDNAPSGTPDNASTDVAVASGAEEFDGVFDATVNAGNTQEVVYVNGSWFDMGRQYGLGVRTVTWTAAYAASPNRLLRLSIVS